MRFEGYHAEHTLPIKSGDVVTILKGTTIKTAHPGTGSGYLTAGRTYKIKVHHLMSGMTITRLTCNYERGETPGPKQNPGVVWAGRGGYWHEVDINALPECNRTDADAPRKALGK